MTLESAQARCPRAIEVYRLHVEQGLGHKAIAARLGISVGNVYTQIKRARDFLAAPEPAQFEPTHVTRCRCRLAPPCHDCIKPAWQVASLRFGESAGTF